ncbi:MAG: family 16 glycosylhydrolase [Bacteroidales bacterium]
MKYFLLPLFAVAYSICLGQSVDPYSPDASAPPARQGMHLVFNEEFKNEGKPNPQNWGYEIGFKRNEELQWYQSDNASCTAGRLLIEGRRANFPNPNYVAGSTDWRTNRKTVNYTSSSILTKDKKSWLFGRFEIRARVDTSLGAWPAIWTLGVKQEWPSCGEIDLMEFYRVSGVPTILANVAWGTAVRWTAKWDSFKKPLASLLATDANWPKKYHVWRMDWTPDSICLYVDNVLFNYTLVSQTINADGSNPFLQPQYMLLNLALGGGGGDPSSTVFPIKYEVDYVRIYQKDSTALANRADLIMSKNPICTKTNRPRALNFKYNDDLKELNVSIFNSRGTNLFSQHYADIQNGNPYSIDLSRIPTGLFFVRFNSEIQKTFKMILTE